MKLPLGLVAIGDGHKETICDITDADGELVAENLWQSEAAAIVTACNAYPELLAAISPFARLNYGQPIAGQLSTDEWIVHVKAARALLARLEPK